MKQVASFTKQKPVFTSSNSHKQLVDAKPGKYVKQQHATAIKVAA